VLSSASVGVLSSVSVGVLSNVSVGQPVGCRRRLSPHPPNRDAPVMSVDMGRGVGHNEDTSEGVSVGHRLTEVPMEEGALGGASEEGVGGLPWRGV